MIKLSDLLFGVSIKSVVGDITSVMVEKIEFDSRKVFDSDLFIAIKGVTIDGHLFIDSSIINGAKSVNYIGAGTIEYLLDANNDFYFMEMNTRLQVEHPVTEMVTNTDLVKQQILAALGEKLNLSQKEIIIKGHSIECRINAEHPETFIPSPGKVKQYHQPGGLGVRIDSSIYQDSSIPPHYDSMIAKLITFADNRIDCIQKMKRALEEYVIMGIDTNIQLHQKIIESDEFLKGNYDINFMSRFKI